MYTAIAKSYPSSSAFDAGRQPFSRIPSNHTPQTKTKRSVIVERQYADHVLYPQPTTTHHNPPVSRSNADDEDIPLAHLMNIRSASSAATSSTLEHPGQIRRRGVVEVDDDEDVPLVKVKERMMKKFDIRPIIKRVIRRQPPTKPKKFGQTVRDLGPNSIPMMCVLQDCPYDWHVHVKTTNHLDYFLNRYDSAKLQVGTGMATGGRRHKMEDIKTRRR